MADNPELALATQRELEPVYENLRSWLVRNGSHAAAIPAMPYGIYDGLPIHDEGAASVALVDGARLRRMLPDAAAALRIGSHMLVGYTEAHCEPPEDGTNDPPLRFGLDITAFIFKEIGINDDESLIFGPYTYVDPFDGSESWGSIRRKHSKDESVVDDEAPISPTELDTRVGEYMLGQISGAGRMTVMECVALQQVADNLSFLADPDYRLE